MEDCVVIRAESDQPTFPPAQIQTQPYRLQPAEHAMHRDWELLLLLNDAGDARCCNCARCGGLLCSQLYELRPFQLFRQGQRAGVRSAIHWREDLIALAGGSRHVVHRRPYCRDCDVVLERRLVGANQVPVSRDARRNARDLSSV